MLNPLSWVMIITASIPLKSIKYWSPMVSLEQREAWYSLKNFFDLYFSACLNKWWAWEILSEFVIFLLQNPPLCSTVRDTVVDAVALYSEAALKTSLFPSKSDTQVKGAIRHVVSSTGAWQLPSSSAYSSLPLSLQNDVLESLVCIWPLSGLIYDSRDFFPNCINLYILNVALGYSTLVSGLNDSVFWRVVMLVYSKDWFNRTKSPNLEPNPNLANQIHSAKHVSTWFMARKCLNCNRVNRFELFS